MSCARKTNPRFQRVELGMEQRFKVDLRMVEGDGEFPCPACNQIISPEDESGVTYGVLEVETGRDGTLQDATIQCRKCGSLIRLEGFDLLNEIVYSDRLIAPEDRPDLGVNIEG